MVNLSRLRVLVLVGSLVFSAGSSSAEARKIVPVGSSRSVLLAAHGTPRQRIEKEVSRTQVWEYPNFTAVIVGGAVVLTKDLAGALVQSDLDKPHGVRSDPELSPETSQTDYVGIGEPSLNGPGETDATIVSLFQEISKEAESVPATPSPFGLGMGNVAPGTFRPE